MKESIFEVYSPKDERELTDAQRAKDEAWGTIGIEGSIKQIYKNFPEGFLTAFVDGIAAGNFTTLKMNYDLIDPPKLSWEELTHGGKGDNFVKDGDTLYGVSLGVSPKYRQNNVGAKLVYFALQKTVEFNCKQFVLGCRIPDYHKYSDIPVEDYITLKRKDGEFLDKELRFYSRCGLRFLKPLPDYMIGKWADPESLNYGVLSVWTNPFYAKNRVEE